jgi:hypothetical protein
LMWTQELVHTPQAGLTLISLIKEVKMWEWHTDEVLQSYAMLMKPRSSLVSIFALYFFVINYDRQYLSFCAWLILANTMCSNFTQIPSSDQISCFFNGWVALYIYIIYIIIYILYIYNI